jgi:hypothetical protein
VLGKGLALKQPAAAAELADQDGDFRRRLADQPVASSLVGRPLQGRFKLLAQPAPPRCTALVRVHAGALHEPTVVGFGGVTGAVVTGVEQLAEDVHRVTTGRR